MLEMLGMLSNDETDTDDELKHMFGNQLGNINTRKAQKMYNQGQNQMDIFSMSRRMPLLGFFGANASDDDLADRLNYKYTVAILIIFAFVVTNKHFGHNQISCWVPALFSKNFEEYTNLVCWITNTYYIPLDKHLPESEPERRHTELRYYQWVAYILLFLSLLFYLPRLIWRSLSLRSGVDIKDIIEASHDFKSVSKIEKNRKMMEYMIGTIDQYVDDPRRQHCNRNISMFRRTIGLMCFMFGKFLGNYLVVLYLFIKMLYIVNCLGQLFLISVLLGRNYYIYGATIFRDIIQGKGYADSEYFPRVTMCKFQVRELALKNFSHEYNVQCVLPINLFNQQIFTFLWFWYLVLLIINTASLLIWCYRFIPINQYNYVIRRIKLLRIRLIETSKLTGDAAVHRANASHNNSNTNQNNTPGMNASNELSNRKKTPIARIMNEIDYHYSYDENDSIHKQSRRDSNKKDKNEELMFPNINQSFEFANIQYAPPLTKHSNQKRRQEEYSNIRIPIITEYDTYMSPNSFCIKNYKKFVYEYLEADGMFMLRMIGSNSGDFVCTQVLHNLWKLFLFKKYTIKQEKIRLSNSNVDEVYITAPHRRAQSIYSNMNINDMSSCDSEKESKTKNSVKAIRKFFKESQQKSTKGPTPNVLTTSMRGKSGRGNFVRAKTMSATGGELNNDKAVRQDKGSKVPGENLSYTQLKRKSRTRFGITSKAAD